MSDETKQEIAEQEVGNVKEKIELLVRIKNWVVERPSKAERNVRHNIAHAIEKDIVQPPGTDSVDNITEKTRDHVQRKSKYTRQQLNELYKLLSETGEKRVIKSRSKNAGDIIVGLTEIEGRDDCWQVAGTDQDNPNTDSVVPEQHFVTRLVRDNQTHSWISEEVTPEGRIISQSRIYDDPARSPELSLMYRGAHYDDLNADPSISVDTRFPTGAHVLFLNHTASLGMIKWNNLVNRFRDRVIGPVRSIASRYTKKD